MNSIEDSCGGNFFHLNIQLRCYI